jgi:hypothetical protein
MYRRIYEELESDRDKNDKLVKGKQEKFVEFLRKEKGLTQKQRAFLFTLSSDSVKNNPFGGYGH